jgi:glycerol uptake facilitator-like aquaporin
MNKLLAESFGTFWLVLGGCGSAVLAAAFPGVGIGLHGVSLAFGLTVLTMAYAIGCRRRSKSEPPRRPNIEPGVEADFDRVGCG